MSIEQEPIAWILEEKETGYKTQIAYRPSVLKKGWEAIPLYPEPKREPLSDEAVCKILLKKEWKGFVDLVRIIEKEHGIGGGE